MFHTKIAYVITIILLSGIFILVLYFGKLRQRALLEVMLLESDGEMISVWVCHASKKDDTLKFCTVV